MIIANLVGGLGNQMFQYACARSLSLDLNMPLSFTIDMFTSYSAHNGFELEKVFGLKLNFSSNSDLEKLIGWARKKSEIRHLLSKRSFRWLSGRNFLGDLDLEYFLKKRELVREGAYLHGYWQSERYFANNAARIRADFKFQEELQGINRHIAHSIDQGTAVSIHIRRGDYVINPKAFAVHGICSSEYYHTAIKTLLSRYPDAKLFAFSDDPSWTAQMIKPYYPELILVDHNTKALSYCDMQLMSLCDHHIIANSSFSWWGAWLNNNPNKTVIAPRRWFSDESLTDEFLIPASWERI